MATFQPTNIGSHASGRKKTICTSHVLSHFGISYTQYHYSEGKDTVKGVLRRSGYSVRSRASLVGLNRKSLTVTQVKKSLIEKDGNPANHYYMGVVGHAMVINGAGQVLVDTDPRTKGDRRKVTHINLVYKD